MEVKVLEVRDHATFIPVICIRPVAANKEQRYLLRRDGYRANEEERCVLVTRGQAGQCFYDPYDWNNDTMLAAHLYIEKHWAQLEDGAVIDVEFITGKSDTCKLSERITAPL